VSFGPANTVFQEHAEVCANTQPRLALTLYHCTSTAAHNKFVPPDPEQHIYVIQREPHYKDRNPQFSLIRTCIIT